MINLMDPVSTLMSTDLFTVEPTEKLKRVKEILEEHGIHHVPVVNDEKLAGIISKSDLLYFLKATAGDSYEPYLNEVRLKNYTAEEAMTSQVTVLNPNDPIKLALKIFQENLFHALPIVEDGKLVGLVTTFDIINALLEERKLLI